MTNKKRRWLQSLFYNYSNISTYGSMVYCNINIFFSNISEYHLIQWIICHESTAVRCLQKCLYIADVKNSKKHNIDLIDWSKIYVNMSTLTILPHMKKDICSSFMYKQKIYENISTLTFLSYMKEEYVHHSSTCGRYMKKKYLLCQNGCICHVHLSKIGDNQKKTRRSKNQNV